MSTLETLPRRYEQYMINVFEAKATNSPIDHYVCSHIVIYRNIGSFCIKNMHHNYVAHSDDMTSLEYSWMSEMCSGDVTYPVTIS